MERSSGLLYSTKACRFKNESSSWEHFSTKNNLEKNRLRCPCCFSVTERDVAAAANIILRLVRQVEGRRDYTMGVFKSGENLELEYKQHLDFSRDHVGVAGLEDWAIEPLRMAVHSHLASRPTAELRKNQGAGMALNREFSAISQAVQA